MHTKSTVRLAYHFHCGQWMILQDEVRLLHNCHSISREQAKKTYVLRSDIVQPEIVGSCGKSTPGYTLIDNTLIICQTHLCLCSRVARVH